jgi:cephalosporin hydroxylase
MIKSDKFKEQCRSEVESQGKDKTLLSLTQKWVNSANSKKYSYHYEWLGRPIIQYPQGIFCMHQLARRMRLDLLTKNGIVFYGPLALSATILASLVVFDVSEHDKLINPNVFNRKALGIDNDLPRLNNNPNSSKTAVRGSKHNTALKSFQPNNCKPYGKGLNGEPYFDIQSYSNCSGQTSL